MAIEFNGTPFQYNPAVTNINIDNQLAGVLAQFSDDYIMDVVKDSLNNRFRIYSLPAPNVVAAFESTFKQLTDGFSSYSDEIMNKRKSVYINIINTICDFYEFTFNANDDTDYYSAAYTLYNFFVCCFTEYLKNFYTMFLIGQKDSIYATLDLANARKENEPTFGYSKKLFKDSKIAAIHCNVEMVINQISSFPIDLPTVIQYACTSDPLLGQYIATLVNDPTGQFFNKHYQEFVIRSKDSADIITYIKLALQQIGGEIESIN